MEQVLDWLNENELRAYPLMAFADKTLNLTPAIKLPDNFLLDLQLVSYTGLAKNIVALTRIARTSTDLRISFGVVSPTISITTFTIPVAVITAAAYPYYLRNSDGCLAVFGAGTSALYNACTNSTDLSLNISIEPALCTQFNDAWLGVASISVSPEKAGDTSNINSANWSHPKLPLTDVITANKAYLTGDVQLLEGYNFRVKVNNDLIDLEVGANFGLKMACGTSFLPPECLDCYNLVSYINGVPPDANGNFRLLEGSNVLITSGAAITTIINDQLAEPANQHSLFVGLTFQATDLCAAITAAPSV